MAAVAEKNLEHRYQEDAALITKKNPGIYPRFFFTIQFLKLFYVVAYTY